MTGQSIGDVSNTATPTLGDMKFSFIKFSAVHCKTGNICSLLTHHRPILVVGVAAKQL